MCVFVYMCVCYTRSRCTAKFRNESWSWGKWHQLTYQIYDEGLVLFLCSRLNLKYCRVHTFNFVYDIASVFECCGVQPVDAAIPTPPTHFNCQVQENSVFNMSKEGTKLCYSPMDRGETMVGLRVNLLEWAIATLKNPPLCPLNHNPQTKTPKACRINGDYLVKALYFPKL